jgi:hypothetical protein
MSFQGTEKEEAKQRRTCLPPYSIVGEQREEPFVISSLGSFFDSFPQPGILSLFCKNCGVQCLLGRKVFEAQCLTATGCLVDLVRGRSGKAVCGKHRCHSTDLAGLPLMT